MTSSKFGLLAALGLAAALVSATCQPAVFNVDTTVDDPSLTGCDDATINDCSLRGAILKANGLSEAVTINVPAGTYVLSQPTPCFFRGNDIGPLYTTQALCPVGILNIIGAGADATIIDANQPPGQNFVRAPVMLVATTASVRLQGMALRHGNYSGGSTEGHGGAINNAGTLVIEDSVVSDNYTSGAGGGIFNQRNLTVLRSVITRNFSATGGGGIVNTNLFTSCQVVSPCEDGQGILSIADSTISENVSGGGELGGFGAGIMNADGVVDIAGSTINGNVSNTGSGGGIYNAAYTVNLTNVTVSGNRAALGGGIMNTGPSASTLHLNNVTIANNTAQSATDPTSGLGGGLVNGANGTVTLANTIIAGNSAAGSCTINGCIPPGNDCLTDAPHGGALTSQGYNLVQDTQACDIFGDTTGNITGKDPLLGVLADNGGRTFTHALSSGSPAIDAGDPASPGSGGTACAVTDQRAFLRPLGPRCDVGAFERSGAFAVANVFPASGGNAGQVSVQVGGGGFVDGSSVKLSRTGQADIAAARTQVDIGGASIAATFDLTGASPGTWDVVVTNPDSTSSTLSGGFTVRPGIGPRLWLDVVGVIPRSGPGVVMIIYGNRGDADAIGVPLSLSVPQGYAAGKYFAIAPPPAQPGQVLQNWDFVPPIVAEAQDSFLQLPLLLPIVPSGFTGVLRIALTLPANAQDSFLLTTMGDPLFATGVTQEFIDNAVAGAQTYVQQTFGVTVPTALISQLQQYAATQMRQVVANGQNAFAATLGTDPLVYSLAQLQLDIASFALAATVPATP